MPRLFVSVVFTAATTLVPMVTSAALASAEKADDASLHAPSGPMRCEPSVLAPGDTLRVTFPFPHGPYFMIREPSAPHGYFLTLTAPLATQEQAGKHLIAGERFEKMREIALPVADAKAVTFTSEWTVVKIFRRPGKYHLTVGEQFETEAPIVEGQCFVEYRR